MWSLHQQFKSPGVLLELLILGSCPRPTESETVGVGPNSLSLTILNLENHFCKGILTVWDQVRQNILAHLFNISDLVMKEYLLSVHLHTLKSNYFEKSAAHSDGLHQNHMEGVLKCKFLDFWGSAFLSPHSQPICKNRTEILPRLL